MGIIAGMIGDPNRYGLGLERNIQRLSAHNPLWAQAYAEEVARLRPALDGVALAVEHYGSTAVPGLDAKPIIDIQVGVTRLEQAQDLVGPMTALGYDNVGSAGIADHHIFGLGVARTHLVHIVEYDSEQWRRAIRFRDRLRAEPALRDAYQQLKRELAATCATRAEYTEGKSAFVAASSA